MVYLFSLRVALFITIMTCFLGIDRNCPAEGMELRILCYNIHHGEGADGVVDIERVAELINREQPDLVALQEVDDGVNRSNKVKQIEELAKLTGLHGKFIKQIDYDGGEYGQGVLSRYPILSVQTHILPGDPPRESRIAGVARIDLNATELLFATTHLHHNNSRIRLEQAKQLIDVFADEQLPCILAGDLNATPESDPIAVFARSWIVSTTCTEESRALLTYPAKDPSKQLDYVIVRPRASWKLKECRVIEEMLTSDHRPLLFLWELSLH